MTHPERERVGYLEETFLHATQVAQALGLTFKMVDYWLSQGIIHSRQVTRTSEFKPASGSGSVRIFSYPQIHELSFVAHIRRVCEDLDTIKKLTTPVPPPYSNWGDLIIKETLAKDTIYASFNHTLPDTTPPALHRGREQLAEHIPSTLSLVLNLSSLRKETDTAIQQVKAM